VVVPTRNGESESDVDGLAASILEAASARLPIPPITDSHQSFDLAAAYRVASAIKARRVSRGEKIVGWKIGFTNSAIWVEQGLNAPIWGPMYDTTVSGGGDETANFEASRLLEPRIEPEIAFRLGKVPNPGMDESELIACVDAVTHGFEIVQSIYPGWKLTPPDAVAAFGMHGGYRHGKLVPVAAADRAEWLERLVAFDVVLFRDRVEVDRGAGKNVLGGPLTALRHFVDGAARYLTDYPLRPGDLITTGTLTKALPIAPGETWSTELSGIPLSPMKINLT
jgi:2-oxo-3-hexenedioate decarboxylase